MNNAWRPRGGTPAPYRRRSGGRRHANATAYGARRRGRRWRLTPTRFGLIVSLVLLAAIAWLQQTDGRKPANSVQYSYFSSCADARAKGAAPIRQGVAGYRPQLDADGDGVACEPYSG